MAPARTPHLFVNGERGRGIGAMPAPGRQIPPPNITRGGRLGTWSEADFIKALRTGVTPRNYELDPDQMPSEKSLSRLTDVELKSVMDVRELGAPVATEG